MESGFGGELIDAHEFLYHQKVMKSEGFEYFIDKSECLCDKETEIFDEKCLRKGLSEYFKIGFAEVRKIIPPEYRRMLVNMKDSVFSELLEGCYMIRTLKTGIIFTDCQKFKASFVNLADFSLHLNDDFNNFTELTKKSAIEEYLVSLIRKTDSTHLDKFSVNIKNLSNKPLQVLIYLGKGLTLSNKFHDFQARCAYCTSKLSSMKKKGLKLPCNHSICFECHMTNIQFMCPLDNLNYNDTLMYINLNLNIIIPNCQGSHNLYSTSKIIKLECGHVSCNTCLSNGKCQACFRPFNPFIIKLAEKIEKWVKCQVFYCDLHEIKAEFFNMQEFRFYCKYCEKKGNMKISEFYGFGFFENVFNMAFLQLVDSETCKLVEYSCEFLKKCSYFNVLTLGDKYEVVRTLLDIEQETCSLLRKQVKIEFFSEVYPICAASRKVLNVQSGFCVFVEFFEHFMVNGIIIGGKFFVSDYCENVNPCYFMVNKIEFRLNEDVLAVQDQFEPVSGKSVEIKLNGSIFVQPLKKYSIYIELPAGHYFHGAPFYRQKNSQASFYGKSDSRFNLLGLIITPI